MRLGLCSSIAIAASIAITACRPELGVDLRLPLSRTSDEEKIAAILQDVHNGMETKRVYKILAHVSPHYSDQDGRDYEALREYLSTVFRSYRTIRITRAHPRIAVQGDKARAIDTFGTIAEPADPSHAPPINLQGQVAVQFERLNNTWQIVEWGPLH